MTSDDSEGRVAIIALASRTPGAGTADQLWDNVVGGKICISPLGDDELLAAGASHDELSRADYVKAAACLTDVEQFDASFFYLSGREAEKMDPQLRTFLESSWEVLERAGYNSESYAGSIGVFAGCLQSTYLLDNLCSQHVAAPLALVRDLQARMGNDPNYLSSRVSYHLGLSGPSLTVQSACSTSLLAVHQAVQSLLGHECDLALAGGVSIRFPQKLGYRHQRDGILSPDGQCRPFDHRAAGTLFGDGLGVVVLKRLGDAVRDRDTILATVLGSATGNDGSDRVGYAAPGGNGQARVIAEALAAAAVDPATVSYVEAHGTGTAMGDPIELAALAQAYEAAAPCWLGSVKANLGHLSIAAGVTSLIKVVQMLRHREIPPQVNFEAPNPECNLEHSRFRVATARTPWRSAGPLRAGISSFGMGGTNVHVVLEEPPAAPPPGASRPLQLLLLSAKSPESLAAARSNAAAHLAQAGASLADAAYTYAVGRRTFNHRSIVVADSEAAASRALEVNAPSEVLSGSGQPGDRPVVFLFPGQGVQRAGMAADLYRHEPEYRRSFDACADLLQAHTGLDLREVVYPDTQPVPGERSRLDIHQTRYTQPALFAVEYSLARLWMSWGITPAAMIGHSVGEYVAAALAEVFELDTAVRLVAERGRLMQELPRGSMVSVLAAPEAVAPYLEPSTGIAAVNEPGSCTISGPTEVIDRICRRLETAGIAVRAVTTSHAFHSSMMAPAAAGLRKAFAGIEARPPKIPFVSNLTGDWISDEQARSAEYWAEHVTATVQFADGLSRVFRTAPGWVLLECGPGQTLSSYARRHPDRETQIAVFSSLGRPGGELREYRNLLTCAGQLWLTGLSIDHHGFYRHEQRRRIALPTYPFERRRYFIAPDRSTATAQRRPTTPERQPVDRWFHVPSWSQERYAAGIVETGALAAGTSLVFADGLRGARLAASLARSGDTVVVRPGDRFAIADTGEVAVRPGSKDDHAALLAHLADAGRTPRRVLHAWSLDNPAAPSGPVAGFEIAQARGLYSLTAFAQAWAQRHAGGAVRVVALTRGAMLVTGAEPPSAEQATLALACRAIRQEHPSIDCRHLDLDPADDLSCDLAVAAWWRELLEHPRAGLSVAYRHGRRWVESFVPTAIAADGGDGGRLRRGQTVLITGGLGHIGAEIAAMLHDRWQTRLALVTRDPLPDEPAWEAYAAAHGGATGATVSRALALRSRGAAFVTVACDVGVEPELRRAVAEVEARLGKIDGVIHAAGLPAEHWDRTVETTGHDIFQSHFAAKAHGALALETIFADRELEFCLLMSSLAGVLGGLRLLPYGAANRFLDAVAHRVNRRLGSSRWISVDWDVWQHHQDEKRERSQLGKIMDDKAIQPAEGLAVIRRVLASDGIDQVAVSTWDLQHRIDQWLARPLAGGGASALPAPAGDGASSLEAEVLALLRAALGANDIALDADIFEHGGDSLMIVQLLARLRDSHDVDIPLAEFLDQPTARALVALIHARTTARDDIDALVRGLAQLPAADAEALLFEIESMEPSAVELSLEAVDAA